MEHKSQIVVGPFISTSGKQGKPQHEVVERGHLPPKYAILMMSQSFRFNIKPAWVENMEWTLTPLGKAIEWSTPSEAVKYELLKHQCNHIGEHLVVRTTPRTIPNIGIAAYFPFKGELYQDAMSLLEALYRTHDVTRPWLEFMREMDAECPIKRFSTGAPMQKVLSPELEARGFCITEVEASGPDDAVYADVCWIAAPGSSPYHVASLVFELTPKGYVGQGSWSDRGNETLLEFFRMTRLSGQYKTPKDIFTPRGKRLLTKAAATLLDKSSE